MKIIIYLIPVIAGMSLSIEGAIYGELGKTIGKMESSFYNFFAGTIIIGLIWLFFGKGNLGYTLKAPKWTLLGGLLGTIYLTVLVISIPLVGVGLSMVTVIIGQMVMSMVIEHFGWLGSEPVKINKEKVTAVLLMGLALAFIF
ncbi:DMT family transporter [Metabacillus sp. GX 13764]|uniref:DMT family transporter n=1 Tax=Metabacillus kandeliae TaxID=2900151 RepID=UPI001E4627E1|nr:DMT family transporter [Metabacillus kandeliae]MCD7036354.1 DMT family transporter [Metabacillus kandeliae]